MDDEPIIDFPADLMSVADLNYMVAALLAVGSKMLGPDFIPEVCKRAELLRNERDIASFYHAS